MRHGRIIRAVSAALVIPLVLLVGLRSAWALYTCRIDGVVRSSCCCSGAHGHAAKKPVAPGRVVASSCCAISVHAPGKAPDAQAPARADDHPPPTLIAIQPPRADVAPAPIVATIDRASARPPPLASYVLKQAFLR